MRREYASIAAMAALLVGSQAVAIALSPLFQGSGYQAFPNPSDVTNTVVYVILILVFTAVILGLVRYRRQNLAKVGLDPSAMEPVRRGGRGPDSKPVGEPLPVRLVDEERRSGVFENLIAEFLSSPSLSKLRDPGTPSVALPFRIESDRVKEDERARSLGMIGR